jgi:hypothetical protein
MNTTISKRALSTALGVGALGLLASRASADTAFTQFAFPATGAPTPRTIPDRLGEIKNVKDFGALGNGSTDDTSAIQAAVNAALATGGTVFFPVGRYTITRTIVTPPGSSFITLRGAGLSVGGSYGVTIGGNVNGFLVQKDDNTDGYGLYGIDNICFNNVCPNITNPAGGGCVQLSGIVNGIISNCFFMVPASTTNTSFGILANGPPNNVARGDVNNLTILGCAFNGGGVSSGSIGVQGGQITVQNCSFQHLYAGVQQSSEPLVCFGNRFELNHRALYLGVTSNGATSSAFVNIFGNSFESNDIGIEGPSGISGWIANAQIPNYVGGGTYGVKLVGASSLILMNVNISGAYTTGISIQSASNVSLINCSATNITAGGTPWVFPISSRNGLQLTNCDTTLPITFSELPGQASSANGIRTPLEGMTYDITDCSTSTFLATAAGGGAGSSAHRRVRYNAAALVWQVIG